MIGRTLGHYKVVEKLGEGGMGVVYRARQERLNRDVVLKVLRDGYAGDADRHRRFLQEAVAASALNSPNIIAIYDVAREDDLEYIVMEFVQGQPLDFLIPTGGMNPSQAVNYSLQIAQALEIAHNAGIIHRDLKPANVMVTSAGVVKLLDFGLAKLTSAWRGAAVGGPATIQGSIIGTVCYMSPEQALAKPLDGRADLFSFGALMYEMLTGQRAFGHASTLIALTSVIRDTPPYPSSLNPAVPRELSDIVMRCLAKQPDDRFATAGDVRRALLALPQMADAKDSGILDACAEGHRALNSLNSASLAKARACFEFAVRSGSDDPEVWSGMCQYYADISLLGMAEPAEVLPKAIWAAKKALDRDARAQAPRVVIALLRANHEYSWGEVGQTLEAASARDRALWFLRPTGRFDEAEDCLKGDNASLAWIALERGDIASAVQAAAAADLDSWLACWVQSWAFIANARVRQAIETCEGALRLEPGNSWLESSLATALAMTRQPEAARRIINQPHWKPASFAIPTLIALGDTGAAFEKARDALKRRDPRLVTVLRLPILQPYRTDARYRELLSGLNLAG